MSTDVSIKGVTAAAALELIKSTDGALHVLITGGGVSSPLTTKGDIFGYSTVDARIPVGANGEVLSADSTQALGVKWIAVGGTGTVTSVSVTSANGVSGSVATATTTPAITLTLGSITPTLVTTPTATLGVASTTTGVINLYNSASTFATTLQAGNAAAARTYTWPTNFGSAGTVLTDAAGNGTLSWGAVASGTITIGTTALASGTATRLLYETATNKVGEISGATSDGTTLTLVAPVLGTPASGVLTNCTGTAAGLTAGTVTTNANLTGHVTSTGNATVLGSFTSAQLATALTDETGSGAAMFATNPAFGGYYDLPAIAVPAAPGATSARIYSIQSATGWVRTVQKNSVGADVVLGRDSVVLVNNAESGAITVGQVVYVSGTVGGLPQVLKARANSASTLPALGLVMDASIASGAVGQVQVGGVFTGNTAAFSTGDQLYVSTATAGALQSTRPSGTSAAFVQRIGTVTVSNASTGTISLAVAPFIGNLETGTTAATWTGNAIVGTTVTASGLISVNGGMQLAENTSLQLDAAGSADGKYSGITIAGTAGEALAFGDVIVLDVTAGKWFKGSVSAAAAADGDLRGGTGMCVLAAAGDASATTVLLMGTCRADANFPALTIGSVVYATTAGDITVTQPSTTDHVIKVLGFALTADEIMFSPSMDYITHT